MRKNNLIKGAFLLVLLASILLIGVIEAQKTSNKIDLIYDISSPSFDKVVIAGIEYDTINIQGLERYEIPGNPILPSKIAKILLPQGVTVKEIVVQGKGKEVLSGNYNLAPAQRPVPLLRDLTMPETLPNEELYSSSETYPSANYYVLGEQQLTGHNILILSLYPVEYVPSRGEVSYYKQMQVEVYYEMPPSPTAAAMSANQMYRATPVDNSRVKDFVDNPGQLAGYSRASRASSASKLDPESYDYLMITNNEFASSTEAYNLETLKASKEAKGLSVKIETVENIYDSYSGADAPEKIRNFIRDAYNTWGITYVLLVGDADGEGSQGDEGGDNIVPVRYLRSFAEGITEDIPSDLYYSCLDGTFDYNGDGIYGEPGDGIDGGEVDLLAEVYVGRAPVDSVQELSNFVRKTLQYEDLVASSDPYLRSVIMAGEGLGYYMKDSKRFKEEIKEGACTYEYCTEGFPSGYFVETLYDADTPWSPQEIIDLINQNPHIINHLGHANVPYVMKFRNNDVDTLLTNTKPFFAYSQGCLPGAFDNGAGSRHPASSDCIAEHMLGEEFGAFAVVFNSRYGWGIGHPSIDGPSQRFDRQFFDAIYGEEIFELGKINQDSKEDNIWGIVDGPDCGEGFGGPWPCSGVIRWVYYETNLLGDPEVSLHIPPKADHEIGLRAIQGPDEVMIGGQGIFSVDIKNRGLNDETNVEVKFYVEDDLVDTQIIPNLISDETATLDFTYLFDKSGEYSLKVMVTPVPGEDYLVNNEKEKKVDALPAVLNGIYSDYGVDIDGNGLYDFLAIDVGIDAGESQEYNVGGELRLSQGDYIGYVESGFTYVDRGTQKVLSLLFPAAAIYPYRSEGTYELDYVFLDSLTDRLGSARGAHETSFYSYDEFEIPPARLTSTSDSGVDTDNNDLYNYLAVEQTIEVDPGHAGEYRVRATLHTPDGWWIISEESYFALEEGDNDIIINLPGYRILQSEVNGPYFLAIHLKDEDRTILDQLVDVETREYDYDDFDGPPASFNDIYSDYGVDTDGDGLYNTLIVNVGVSVQEAGIYEIRGDLYEGRYSDSFHGMVTLEEGEQTVALKFNGATIRRRTTDGPYHLTFLEIENEQGDELDHRWDAYDTFAYSYEDFEDLKDVSAYIPWAEVIVDEPNDIRVVIENVGTSNAHNILVTLYEDQGYWNQRGEWVEDLIEIGYTTIGELSVNEVAEPVFSWAPTTSGDTRLKLTAEYNEDEYPDNNEDSNWIMVRSRIDVQGELTYSWKNYVVDEEAEIEFRVQNLGIEDAQDVSASLYDIQRYWDGGEWKEIPFKIGEVDLGAIEPYNYLESEFFWTPLEAKDYRLRLRVECEGDRNPDNDEDDRYVRAYKGSLLKNIGGVDLEGYLIFKIQEEIYDPIADEWDWVDYYIIIDDLTDSNLRVLSPGENIDLSDLFPRDYSINDPGNYRVYAGFVDEFGEPISTFSQYLEEWHHFNVWD